MLEPYLSQERLIKEHIKFHENEIERLHESLQDISYNSTMKQNSRIDEEVPQRVVYGLDKDSPHNNALILQGLTSTINALVGRIGSAEQSINLVAMDVSSLVGQQYDSQIAIDENENKETVSNSFRNKLNMSGNKITEHWENNL